ncbi:MAG: hypothetical protein GXP62_17170 [Oligoflexia bacterium]|nr:hypothetical protein [Oligoflexia bacterium]
MKLASLLLSLLLPALSMSVATALAVSLETPARACTPDYSKVIWTRPADGALAVPQDAVLRVLIGNGDSSSDDFGLSLLHNGQDVAFGVAWESWQGSDLADSRLLLTLTPDQVLLPGATYRLDVVHKLGGEDYGASTVFTVADTLSEPVASEPTVTVVSATDTAGLGDAACDWDQVRTFSLKLEPGQADPDELGVIALYRAQSLEDTWHLVFVHPVGAEGGAQDLSVRGMVGNAWGRCFVAVQRGGAGDKSEASALACAAEPLQPDDGSGDDTGGRPDLSTSEQGTCRGCQSGGGKLGASGVLILAGLLGLRRRVA